MTIRKKEEVAKQILKILEKRGKEYSSERWHSYMLGSLEVLFEQVFARLSDEIVESYEDFYKIAAHDPAE